jgi:putative ABC transport system permease protein
MTTFVQDLRYAVRLLVKSPSFTVVALATLALGIAANAAIFSVVNALLLRPLPYAESERLVMLWQDLRARGGPEDEWLAPAHFFDWRSRATSLESSALFRGSSPSLTGSGDPEQLRGWAVTADFFRMLRVAPALGRDFRPEDDQPGAPATAIITHGLWTRRFGANRGIVGGTISLNRAPVTVIGVLPETFRSPFGRPEIFRPLQLNPVGASRGNITLQMIARLRDGTSFEQAQAELAAVGAAVAAEHPNTDKGATIRLTTLHDEVVGDVRGPVLALLGAVVLVLLIACANIGNLQLARASIRAREIAVRTALGAGRGRIVRQLLTESVLLGIVGSVAGLLLSSWMLDGLLALAPVDAVRIDDIRIDTTVLAFGIVLALATSVVFGLVPALHSVRGDVAATVKEGGKGSGGPRAGVGLRSTFVVAELALALVLLVGAGLFMRTLANIRGVDPGFRPDRLLSAFVAPPAVGYDGPPQVRTFYRSLLERLEGAPGVEQAAIVSVLPFSGDDTDTGFEIEGRPKPASPEDRPTAWVRMVSPGFQRTMGIPIEAGRFIEPRDRENVERVAVINRALANQYWRNENPIGRRIVAGDNPITIVGIVGDVHHRSLQEAPRGQMYLSYEQFGIRGMTVVLKSAASPTALVPVLRDAVAALDPNLPLSSIATMDTLMADSVALPRMITLLMGAFAAASLLLAAIGIYGLMAYTVTLRMQEFGVRMALGAASGDVLRLVLGQAARLAAVGILVGAVASYAAARLIATLLFGVTASDVPTFAVTAVLLGSIALAASYVPARRAVRVNPVTALRAE